MSEPITLTVRGTARAELEPERVTVRFTVAADGPNRDAVLASARTALDLALAAVSAFEAHQEGGGTLDWSVDQLTVVAQRPWTADGSQAPLVHRASAHGQTVSDVDLVAIAALVEALAADPRVTVDGIEWSLTDDSLAQARTNVRTRAVADAIAAAEALAAAVGQPGIRVTALADPGMLDNGTGGPQPFPARAMMAADVTGGFTLQPQPIIVEATVEARCVAE